MSKKNFFLSAALFMAGISICHGQNMFKGYENMFTPPLHYDVQYTDNAPIIDGNINDAAWAKAPWTSYFQDIQGNLRPAPRFKTRAKMLWDKNYLYIAAQIEEPHVWANLKERDQIVYLDNDFEVFINPENTTHNYFEIEVNALNDIFDLFLTKPYRNGGYPLHAWNTPGMLHAVNIQGSLNKADDHDTGWTVELAIPYVAMAKGTFVNVPKDGDIWRLNFSRVEWDVNVVNGKYVKKKNNEGKNLPEDNWVWSPQGVINMHCPERWGYIRFSKSTDSKDIPLFVLPYAEKQKNYLWLVYYKQQDFMAKHNRYATSLKELGIKNDKIKIDEKQNTLSLMATAKQFIVNIADGTNSISLNDDSFISK